MAKVSKILLTGLVLMSLGFSMADSGSKGELITKPKPGASAFVVTG